MFAGFFFFLRSSRLGMIARFIGGEWWGFVWQWSRALKLRRKTIWMGIFFLFAVLIKSALQMKTMYAALLLRLSGQDNRLRGENRVFHGWRCHFSSLLSTVFDTSPNLIEADGYSRQNGLHSANFCSVTWGISLQSAFSSTNWCLLLVPSLFRFRSRTWRMKRRGTPSSWSCWRRRRSGRTSSSSCFSCRRGRPWWRRTCKSNLNSNLLSQGCSAGSFKLYGEKNTV